MKKQFFLILLFLISFNHKSFGMNCQTSYLDLFFDEQSQGQNDLLFDERVQGQIDLLKELIFGGADVNAQNSQELTPLHFAVINRNHEAMRILLKAGALVDKNNFRGATPLAIAVYNEDLTAVDILMENGADPDIPDNYGITPLAIAKENRCDEIVGLLTNH